MKNLKKLLVVAFGLTLLAGAAGAGQPPRGSLQGVWQVAEFTLTGPAARTIVFPEPRANLMILTARHYSRVEVQAQAPRPVLADVSKATADELRTVWGPFVGEAGTYEMSGDVITMRPIAAKNPAAMVAGAFITYTYRQEGNTLWMTQQRNQAGPFPNPFTLKAVRVE